MTTYCWTFWNSVWTEIGRDYIRSDGCARRTITWKLLQQKFVISSRRTRNSQFLENTTHVLSCVLQLQFVLKSRQKVDITLSKICQSHQKLSEWRKVAYGGRTRLSDRALKLFTNLHLKTHENVGVVSSYLSTSWILLNKRQPATEY